MNRKERLRSEMGVHDSKKTREKYTPIFYENEKLAEQTKQNDTAEEKQAVNRRTHKAKPARKHGNLKNNTNYRSDWQSEE